MRAVNELSVRGQGQIACASSGQKALGFPPSLEIDDGNVIAEAVSDVKGLGSGVKDDAAGLEAGGQGSDDCKAGGVNDGDGVGPCVGDEKGLGVGREGNGAWHVTYRDGFDEFAGGDLDYSHFIAVLADYVEQEAIGADRDFEWR